MSVYKVYNVKVNKIKQKDDENDEQKLMSRFKNKQR